MPRAKTIEAEIERRRKLRERAIEQFKGGFPEETKQKIKIALSGEKSYMFGKHKTEETKQKLRSKSIENAKINPNYGMKGKHHTEKTKQINREKALEQFKNGMPRETVEKIRIKNIGQKRSEKVKEKMSYNAKNNINHHKFEFNNIPWNKNLTKENDKRVKRISKLISNNAINNINYGMRGKHHTEEFKQKYKEWRKTVIFPKKDTTIEVILQNYLKQLGVEFLTHQYIHIEHSYQCDIMIPVQNRINKKTIIECFGTYWHKYPLSREIDIQRCVELRHAGWRVLVFWENEIRVMEIDDLKNKLKEIKCLV